MVVYNVSVKVDLEVHEEWCHWMKVVHIPEVLATGAFSKCRFSKLDMAEDDGATYIIQYDCMSMEMLNKYMSLYAPSLQKKTIERYANRFVAFRTYLQVLEEIYPSHSHS